MTHQPDTFGETVTKLYAEPEQISLLAILSLVFGVLGCCTLVTAPIGVLFGILGMLMISRSHGRVGGMGVAIAGLIVSILSMLIWGGVFIGARGSISIYVRQFGGGIEQTLTAIRDGDYDAARAQLTKPASDASDTELAAFHEAYTRELGSFVGLPDGLGELYFAFVEVNPLFESYSGKPGYAFIPLRFDSGWALGVYVDDTSQGGPGGAPAQKILIIGPDGREYTIPPDAGVTASVNRPDIEGVDAVGADSAADSAGESGEEEAPADENADDTDTRDPDEGP